MTRDDVEQAIAGVEHALREAPDQAYEDLASAVRHIGHLRDLLIEEFRRGDAVDGQLQQVNRILSQMVGAEYPLEGTRRERIESVRDQLRQLLQTSQNRC